jgi:glycogen(starch) synthase
MNILHIAPSFPPAIGGVETLVADLAEWQAANGFTVTIVAGTTEADPREERHGGIQVYRLPFVDVLGRQDLGGILELRRRMASLIERHAPELIHLHPVAAEMMFMRDVMRRTDAAVVTTLHVDIAWQPALYQTNLQGLLTRSHAVAAVSRSLLRDAGIVFPSHADRMHLVENGMAWQMASDAVPETGSFLYLGRLVNEKGVDIALRAMALLAESDPDIRLTIAGDGPDRGALEALAETLGLGAQAVAFLGQIERDKVPALIARHTAIVVPSRWQEPFGLVMAEAAMAGRPTIAAASGALKDLIDPQVTGILVAPENAEELAAAMLQLARMPDHARRMGRAAAARAGSEWTIARCGEAYRALYATVADRAR